jgi:hypothetical protein
MVQQVVAIDPCERGTRPLREMRMAAKVLLGMSPLEVLAENKD